MGDLSVSPVIKKIHPKELGQLISASRSMCNDRYKEVYFKLLEIYFFTNESTQVVDNFLHNTAQQDSLGLSLAIHNQRIQALLKENGIYSDDISGGSATRYRKYIRFSMSSDEAVLLNRKKELLLKMVKKQIGEGHNLQQSIVNLLEEMDSFDVGNKEKASAKNKLVAINNFITQLQGSYEKNNKSPSINKKLDEIQKRIEEVKFLWLNAPSPELDRAVKGYLEFSGHFMTAYKQYNEIDLEKENFKEDKDKIYEFRVEQFSKYTLQTLFLGNEVSCCLAVGSSQFEAMVQRIMDDAILFHVAIDEKTGKAAALIWLYFAKCSDGSIALIANFFEINKKYALHPKVKNGLLKGLLEFTSQYCKDNHITHFYMCPLTYGDYNGSLKDYPLETITLADKLGGPYIPHSNENANTPLTQEYYYLRSLKASSFHRFSDEILNKEVLENYTIISAVDKKESSEQPSGANIDLFSSSFSMFASAKSSTQTTLPARPFLGELQQCEAKRQKR